MTAPHPTSLPSTPEPAVTADLAQSIQNMLPDLSVGALLGFATGVAVKFVGRIALIVVGLLFIAVQLLAWTGIITVDWLKLQSLTEPILQRGKEDGVPWVLKMLTANIPFAGAFLAGLALGLRWRT